MIKKIRKIEKKYIIGTILVFISVLIVASIIWGNRTFSVKTLNQIVYHLKVPMEGTDTGVYLDWFLFAVPISLIVVVIFNLLFYKIQKILKRNNSNLSDYLKKHFIKWGICCLVGSLIFTVYNYNIYGYISNSIQSTDIYERYYVDPSSVDITFDGEKRNLIHIYLESIENTYADILSGGAEQENYIPELTELANENINFSHDNNLGGWQTIDGTQWTIASHVSQDMGIPLSLSITSDKYDETTPYLPGGYSLGEVLEDNGYVNEFLCGSDADFGGTSNFYKQHGNYIIRDYNSFVASGEIPSDYFVFWGIEDFKLFEIAKKDITNLATGDQPFNISMVTIDTHTPDGYLCDLCQNNHENQYANVIECQSRQVGNFINWCKQQSWYENTTIVITGDHKSMAEKFFSNIDSDYIRTPYNCIINSAVEPVQTTQRNFSAMDMYPTILAAMGANIDGDRLGLGTNLFSDKETIIEEIGLEIFDQELQKSSNFYKKKILNEGE